MLSGRLDLIAVMDMLFAFLAETDGRIIGRGHFVPAVIADKIKLTAVFLPEFASSSLGTTTFDL
jgi:hypothetical protein